MVQDTSGAVYTRWGNSSCPNSAAQLYTGYMAASPTAGGGATHLCLNSRLGLDSYNFQSNNNPKLNRVEFSNNGALGMMASLEHLDVVCSVCQAPGRSWGLTVAGRFDCPAGFAADYNGYLMAELSTAERTNYICVDGDAQGVPGSTTNHNSATLFPTETADSLSSNYVNGREVTCAQCSSSAGPTYVRWGRSTCPTAASLLYVGRASGAAHNEAGSGTNYVCLHETPVYSTTATTSQAGARLYRAEYETTSAGLYFLWVLQNKDVPCAVCQTTGGLAVMTQHGSSSCPTGWSTEYSGYTMSGPHNTGYRHEYTCVDGEAEAAADSVDTRNTKYAPMSPVELMQEAGNKQQGYTGYEEVTCAVCSKPDPAVTCPTVTAPANGEVACDNAAAYGSKCTMSCNAGFTPSGASSAVCLKAGAAWSAAITSFTCSQGGAGSASAVYVRWGSKTCAATETTVYIGRAMGSRDNDFGSGANRLCMAPATSPSSQQANTETASSLITSLEFDSQSWGTINSLAHVGDLDQIEIPCIVCLRERAIPLPVWGTNRCPLDRAINVMKGYMWSSDQRRAEYMCIQDPRTAVASARCSPSHTCPADGTAMTAFLFDASLGARQGDFLSNVVGSTGGSAGWAWLASLGDHTGVVQRTADSNTGSISTPCFFDSTSVTISMDVLPRKYNTDATFELSIDDVVYASIDIPGSTDAVALSATITTSNGATTSHKTMTTGTTNADLKWTNSWILTLTLPTMPSDSVPLTLSHRAGAGAASDVAIDNLVVTGATCGTAMACICNGGSKFATSPNNNHADNNIATVQLTEPSTELSKLIAGADFGVEMTCAMCMEEVNGGGMYTRWGRNACPAEHTTLHTGYMVGALDTHVSGGAAYKCLSAKLGLAEYSTTKQTSTNHHLYLVEYPAAASLTAIGVSTSLQHKDAACSVCQTPGRAWSLTVPGRQDCPTSFTLDYKGYLMADR